MGKKSEIAKIGAGAAEAPTITKTAKPVTAPAPAIESTPAATAPAANGNGAKKKPAAKPAAKTKVAAPKKAAAKTAPVVTYSQEDVALRAYFICEDRHRNGIAGDSHSDWIEAERQIKAEQKKKKKPASKAVAKKRA